MFFRRYPVCLSFPDRKRINTQYTQRIHSPWSGPVDDVNWRAAPPTLSYSLHLFGLASKEREGGAVFVRSPYSIEYRYSPSPSPSSPFLLYFFFFKKIVSDLCFCFLVRCVTTICPYFLRLASRFAHCSRKETSCHLVVPYAYRIDPYYITLRISTPQRDFFIQTVTVRYLYSGYSDVLGGTIWCSTFHHL